jgi:cysteine-rich repeat protein
VCVATCGDGITVWQEECDDGNVVDGDGCSSTCRSMRL